MLGLSRCLRDIKDFVVGSLVAWIHHGDLFKWRLFSFLIRVQQFICWFWLLWDAPKLMSLVSLIFFTSCFASCIMNTFLALSGSSCHLMDVNAYIAVVLCVHRDSLELFLSIQSTTPDSIPARDLLRPSYSVFLMHSLTWQHDLYLKKAHLGGWNPNWIRCVLDSFKCFITSIIPAEHTSSCF